MTDTQSEQMTSPTDFYSLVIYQNPGYVTALLQQLFGIGLPIEEFTEVLNENMRREAKSGGATGGLKAAASIPLTDISGSIHIEGDKKSDKETSNSTKNTRHQTVLFTQANYLHNVRQALFERGLVNSLQSADSVSSLKPGDFVEFTATFVPNEINAVLDLATPDLVSTIARHLYMKDKLGTFNFEVSHDQRKAAAEKWEIESKLRGELVSAALTALKQDFRNETTSEYFGHIESDSGSITAVTICDTDFFVGRDRDRILDGSFKVLGKVTLVSHEKTSILSRNKFLSRIDQQAIDDLTEKFREASTEGQFDASFKLMIEPPIVKIIPVAIYL